MSALYTHASRSMQKLDRTQTVQDKNIAQIFTSLFIWDVPSNGREITKTLINISNEEKLIDR